MGTRDEHLNQAAANRAHAEYLLRERSQDPTAMQWAVTAAFYCAVHCIEARLWLHGMHCQAHEERFRYLRDRAFQIPAPVRFAYLRLYEHSRNARYNMGRFTADFVCDEVLGHDLPVVTGYVKL